MVGPPRYSTLPLKAAVICLPLPTSGTQEVDTMLILSMLLRNEPTAQVHLGSLSLHLSRTCAFCVGLSAWILLLVVGSEGASRQKVGAILGFTSSASLLLEFTVLFCPFAQDLETVVSRVLSSIFFFIFYFCCMW